MSLPNVVDPQDEPLLEEVQDNYQDNRNALEDIIKQGDVDMRYVDGDPWDPDERRIREAAMRPCLAFDEINQFENQVINQIRANKRAAKFSPVGFGADDDTARFYGDKWREIEYRSNAQIAYTTALQNSVWRSYGYLRLNVRYEHDDSANVEPERLFDQEIWIEEIADPNTILPDHTFKRPDLSDIRHLFVLESWSHKAFLRAHPKAKVQSFTQDVIAKSAGMVTAKDLILAEYWRFVPGDMQTILMVETPEGIFAMEPEQFAAIKGEEGVEVKREREIETQRVQKILTNGVEVLETQDWAGKFIPFTGCFGKMLWRDKGAGSQRVIHSMTRLARSPQMMMAYCESAQAELVRLTPKFPYFFREGSLDANALELLQKSYDEPVVAIPVKGTYDGAPANADVPFPQRAPFEPPIIALEALAESSRKGIQAAMGQSFLPTQAQGRNEKSGVALKQIADAGSQGTYHFIDSFNLMIRRAAEMGEDLIDKIYDTPREVAVIRPDGTSNAIRINQEKPQSGPQGPTPADGFEYLKSTKGRHAVTISVGPSDDSEREAGTEYTSSIVSTPEILQMAGPEKAMKLLALITKLRNLGPIGDAIAEIFDPEQQGAMADLPPQVQAMLKQAQQLMQALQQENAQLKQALQTKQVEQQGKLAQIDAKGKVDASLNAQDNQTDILVAQLRQSGVDAETKRKALEDQVMAHLEALRLELDALKLQHTSAQGERQMVHEAEMAETSHQRAQEGAETAHEQQIDLMNRQPQDDAE
ncbi:MAG: hypothetical protein RLY20_873 [Verrucomicrobiota bacterium]